MRGTSSHEAYEAFVEGSQQFPADSQEEIDLAIARFRQAIGIDPNFARAQGWLAYSYLTVWVGRWTRPPELKAEPELLEAARYHARLAVHLDPFDYSLRWTLMNVCLFTAKRRDDPTALYREGRQQLAWADYLHKGESDPVYLPERMMALCYLGDYGAIDEAIERARPAIPLQPWIRWSIASALYCLAAHEQESTLKKGRYEQALKEVEQVVCGVPVSPYVVEAWLLKAMCHARLDHAGEAGDALNRFADAFEATRPGQGRWTLSDEDTSVSFARGRDRRHWVEGMVLAINSNPSLMPLVPDPAGIGTPKGLAELEKADHPTPPADPVP